MAKILVVEDDLFIQNLMVIRLQDEHHVLVASNGKEGITMAQAEVPDLIIMDLRLPVIDGWTATETLKSSPETESIPILALTAQSFTAVEQKISDVGCDGFVGKPINFPALFSQIDSLINDQIVA